MKEQGFVARFYRPFVFLLLLLAVVFSAACFGVFGSSSDISRWLSGLAGASFAAIALGWLDRLLDTSVQILVDKGGIRARRWSEAPIPWEEVERIEVRRMNGPRLLCLYVRHPDRFRPPSLPGRLAATQNRLLGFGDVSIAMTGTDHDFEDLLDAVRTYGPPRLLQ